ncbi:MAG: GOLPH3/VPS74 family protein [Cyclobacteriaceae bacterium]
MKISIAEGLYLILIDDEEGRLLAAAEKRYIYGLLSAALFDLIFSKKLLLKEGKLQVLGHSGTANVVLDKVLKKVQSGTSFIEQISSMHDSFKHIKEDMDALLVQRGILKREETKLLWIPLSERMGNANYAFEQEIRNGLKAMVLQNAKAPKSFIVLLSLIYDCNILDEVFPERDDFIDAEKSAKDIVNRAAVDQEVGIVLIELRKFFANL